MTQPTEGAAAPAHVLLKNRDAVRAQLTLLINQARHEIRVFAPHLDPYLFNTGDITHLLASFVARDRHNLVHLLVEDSEQTVRDNDRIVHLCQRMSDFVQLRHVNERDVGVKEMFVVVDRLGTLHQQDLTRPEFLSSSADARGAAELLQRFREMWDHSEPVQRLHTTGL